MFKQVLLVEVGSSLPGPPRRKHEASENGGDKNESFLFCIFILNFLNIFLGFKAPTSMFTFLVVNITIAICVAYSCFGCFKHLSPLNYKVSDGYLAPFSTCLCI